jgi:hypothetical protein
MPKPEQSNAGNISPGPNTETIKTVGRSEMSLSLRTAPIGKVNESNRTIEIIWTAGASVRRYDWARDRYYQEQLSQEPGAVRMERLESGKAPFLNSHSSYSFQDVLGVIESATAPSDGGGATVRFSQRADVAPIFQDVQDKILTSVSLGARIHRIEMIAPDVEGNKDWIYRATDWEPFEVSLVPIGADPGATIRSDAGQDKSKMYDCECTTVTRALPKINSPTDETANAVATSTTTKGNTMTLEELQRAAEKATADLAAAQAANQTGNQTTAAPATTARTAANVSAEAIDIERSRVKDIRDAVRASTLDNKQVLIDDYTDRGVTPDTARADILARMAQRSAATEVRGQGGSRIETVTDEADTRRDAMITSVMHRIAPGSVKLTDAARVYRGMSLRELCREGLEAVGISTRGMSPLELASAALGMSQRGYIGTTDLPLIFGGVITRTMRQAYSSAPKTFESWATKGSLTDFRPVTRAAFDAATKFEKVGQSGEYKYGSLVEGGEVIQLGTYGKIVPFTRQMIINDDLSALQRLPQFFGRAAADMESDLVYGIITGNPVMGDGIALFDDAGHKNIATTASKISIDSLSAGRAAMRIQTSPGGTIMNLAPKHLLVPAALETIAAQYTSSAYTPTKSLDQNVFQGLLSPIVEARLDAASATAWYLIGDSAQGDTVEFCYLDGEEGLFTEQTVDFDIDGMKVKGRIDFAAKAMDHRGLYKNAGV